MALSTGPLYFCLQKIELTYMTIFFTFAIKRPNWRMFPFYLPSNQGPGYLLSPTYLKNSSHLFL